MSLSTGELTAIVVGVGNFTAWAKLFYDARKNSTNGTGKPCLLHMGIESKMAAFATEKDGISKEVATLHKENREEHQKLSDGLHALSVASAAATSVAANLISSRRERND